MEALRLLVWTEDDGYLHPSIERNGMMAEDGYSKVKVTELAPYTRYRSGFVSEDGDSSNIGRFSTAFAPDTLATRPGGGNSLNCVGPRPISIS